MSRLKAVILAVIFAALTMLKILCPAATNELRTRLWSAAECEADYSETLTAMGRSFSKGGAAEELISALGLFQQEKIPAATESAATGEEA